MGSSTKTLQYRYDSRGNRSALIDHDGGRFTYAYDTVNRITQVLNPQGDRTTYSYDNAGRRTLKKLANGTRASFTYDAAGNLTKLYNLKSTGAVISSFDYTYDKVGNRTAVLEAGGSRVTWSYDNAYQLTGEYRTGANAYRDTYTYDPAGNRLLKNHDGARTTYVYDAANQLTYSQDASGRTTFTFDADGNQQVIREPSGNRTTYAWDYENRMTLARLPSGVRNTIAYDADGLRVKLEESTGTKKFVWDEQNYLGETDAANDTQVMYTHEPQRYGSLVSQRRGSTSHWHHFDAIGSTRELSDASAIVTDTRLYDAWGHPVAVTGSNVSPLRWVGNVGYYFDSQTGLYYVRARLYSPTYSRWYSFDPLAASIYPSYVYSANSPLMYLDPSGLVACDIRPSRVASMPWCKVGNPRGDFDQETDTIIDPDPNGLESGVWGRTVPRPYRIHCICTCCDPKRYTYSLMCTINVYLQIKIAPTNFPARKVNAFGELVNEGSVYGHEQRHVRNLIECGHLACIAAAEFEKRARCVSHGFCEHMARSAEKYVDNTYLTPCRIAEEAHSNPAGPADQRLNYKPIGNMPARHDCSRPGTAPPLPEGTECCDIVLPHDPNPFE